MNKFLLWCVENLLSWCALFLVFIVICLYRYGYPVYQDYQMSKIEDKIRNNLEEYVVKYQVNKPIPPNARNLEYSSIDLSGYPDVELYYAVKNSSGEYWMGFDKPFNDDAARWRCYFLNYMGVGLNGRVHDGDAMKNVLIADNVKFTHIFLNQSGYPVQKIHVEARKCWG